MGNCIRHESSMRWAGEDWECLASEMNGSDYNHRNNIKISKEKKIEDEEEDFQDLRASGFCKNSCSSSTTCTKSIGGATEVKIKITKKQLEEFLGMGGQLKQMSIQEVLAQLISVSDRYDTQQRSWRPALQSIPEVN